MILYFYDGDIYCRACIREAEPGARFDDDDPTEWELDPNGEPVGEMYYQVNWGVCQNIHDGGCLSETKGNA